MFFSWKATNNVARLRNSLCCQFASLKYQVFSHNNQKRHISATTGLTCAVELAYAKYDEFCDDPAATPIVIAHGLYGSKTNWHSMAKAINKSTKRTVYAVDARCHGDSPHVPVFNYFSMSEDLVRFITTTLNSTRVALVGHSMGGISMLQVAIKQPMLVESITAVDISLESSMTKSKKPVMYVEAMLNARWNDNQPLSEVRKQIDAHLKNDVPDDVVRQFLLMNLYHDGSRVRWRLDLNNIKNNLSRTIETVRLNGCYNGPTLFLCGKSSEYVSPATHDAIISQFPQARFVYIEGAGHFVHHQKPHEFMSELIKFLNSHHKV